MWGRNRKTAEATAPDDAQSGVLRDAVRRTRIEIAEKSGVVVDLRDAELARLELLNEALDPLFKETPPGVDLFDRGISHGDTPRLWIDAVAHVAMGRDKRRYRFVLDTRYGRKVLAESNEIAEIVEAVTHYVASRIIERERALADSDSALSERLHRSVLSTRRRWRRRMARAFLFGLITGAIAVFATLWIVAAQSPH
jgi:hypothetical protein